MKNAKLVNYVVGTVVTVIVFAVLAMVLMPAFSAQDGASAADTSRYFGVKDELIEYDYNSELEGE